MIYCSKHKIKCVHLEQRFNTGSFCIQAREPLLDAPEINDRTYGDIEAPEWCPLQEGKG